MKITLILTCIQSTIKIAIDTVLTELDGLSRIIETERNNYGIQCFDIDNFKKFYAHAIEVYNQAKAFITNIKRHNDDSLRQREQIVTLFRTYQKDCLKWIDRKVSTYYQTAPFAYCGYLEIGRITLTYILYVFTCQCLHHLKSCLYTLSLNTKQKSMKMYAEKFFNNFDGSKKACATLVNLFERMEIRMEIILLELYIFYQYFNNEFAEPAYYSNDEIKRLAEQCLLDMKRLVGFLKGFVKAYVEAKVESNGAYNNFKKLLWIRLMTKEERYWLMMGRKVIKDYDSLYKDERTIKVLKECNEIVDKLRMQFLCLLYYHQVHGKFPLVAEIRAEFRMFNGFLMVMCEKEEAILLDTGVEVERLFFKCMAFTTLLFSN